MAFTNILKTSNSSHTSSIDFVIPVYGKTQKNIPSLVQSLIKYSNNTVGRFYILADRHDECFEKIKRVTERASDSTLVDTNMLLDWSEYIEFCSNLKHIPSSRQGWYWQQIIKLLSFKIPGISDCIVIWDSDTYPCSNITFFNQGIPVLLPSRQEYHMPYYLSAGNIIGKLLLPPFSAISQYAPVRKSELTEIFNLILGASCAKPSPFELYHDQQIIYNDPSSPVLRVFLENLFASMPQINNDSLFSEYELISLYRIANNKSFLVANKRFFRHGGYLPLPKSVIISLLDKTKIFSNVSFEPRHLIERMRVFLAFLFPWYS
jgi:hypothetical protein